MATFTCAVVRTASTINVPARMSVPSGASSARSIVQVPLPCLTRVPLLVTVPVTARLNNCWPTPSRISVELVLPLRPRLPLILLPVNNWTVSVAPANCHITVDRPGVNDCLRDFAGSASRTLLLSVPALLKHLPGQSSLRSAMSRPPGS